VAYITQRFSSLMALFYTLSVCFYIQARLKGQWRLALPSLLLCLLMGLLAIMSKEEAISLPLMIFTVELFFFSDSKAFFVRASFLRFAVGFFIFFLVFLKLWHSNVLNFWRIFVVRIPSESHDGDILTLWTYLLTQIKVLVTFLRLTLWPFPQNLDYDYPMAHSIVETGILLRCVLIGLVGFAAIRLRKILPAASFGILWFFITFSANLVPRANVIWEHKLYLMSFGIFLFLIVLLNHSIRSFRIFALFCAWVILLSAIATTERLQVWKNSLSLWQNTSVQSPNKARVSSNLARAYEIQGDFDKAETYYKQGASLAPLNPSPLVSLGNFYFNLGDCVKAIPVYEKAIKFNTKNYIASLYLGECYGINGNYAKAISVITNGLYETGFNPQLVAWRAGMYIKMQQYNKAMEDFSLIFKKHPGDVNAFIGLADMYQSQGYYFKASSFLDQAVEANPNDERAYLTRGMYEYYRNNKVKAKEDITKAFAINPENPNVYYAFKKLKF
ncbi:MAG: tetratricopeptide repeat protein, partial [Candidatus Omnitrophota bacterium]